MAGDPSTRVLALLAQLDAIAGRAGQTAPGGSADAPWLTRRYAVHLDGPSGWSGSGELEASVSVSCADRQVLRAIDRLCRPGYTVTGPALSAWRLAVHVVAERELSPLGYAVAGAPALDVGRTGLSAPVRFASTGRGWAFAVDRDRTLIDADLRQRIVRVYTGRLAAGAWWAPPLVRQLVTAQVRAAGAVHARAGAVVVGGVGVLIAGPVRSGVTSTVLAALRHLDADLVAVERVLLARGSRGIAVRPWPSPARLGMGTLRGYPDLGRLLGAPDPRPQDPAARPVRGDGGEPVLTIDPIRSDLLLGRGRLVDDLNGPRVMVWPTPVREDVAVDGPGSALATRTVRDRLDATTLFLGDPLSGRRLAVEDWLTDPAPPSSGAASRSVRTMARELAGLPCHRVAVTTRPSDVARQLDAVVTGTPDRPVASSKLGDDDRPTYGDPAASVDPDDPTEPNGRGRS